MRLSKPWHHTTLPLTVLNIAVQTAVQWQSSQAWACLTSRPPTWQVWVPASSTAARAARLLRQPRYRLDCGNQSDYAGKNIVLLLLHTQ